jgi:hypothetical protein
MVPLALESLPPGARPAWVVPIAGDSLAPLYAPTGPAAAAVPPLGMLPRYSVVLVSDAAAAPGRMLVQLTDEARASLKAYPEAQAASAVELDTAVLLCQLPCERVAEPLLKVLAASAPLSPLRGPGTGAGAAGGASCQSDPGAAAGGGPHLSAAAVVPVSQRRRS